MKCLLSLLLLTSLSAPLLHSKDWPEVPGSGIDDDAIRKSEVFDGAGLCHSPKWKASKIDKRLVAYKGPDIAFLVLASYQDKHDDEVIRDMVAKLHRGWAAYSYVIRDRPAKGKNFEGAAAMVAIPRNTAVAIGQGWIGHQGIDVATFYDTGYDLAVKGEVEGYYFYEMGRSWFTGGIWRKFAYDSAFAVHMGAVAHAYAMDRKREVDMNLLDKIQKTAFDFEKLINYDRPTTKKLGADFNVFYSELLIKLAEHDLEWTRRYYHRLLETKDHGGNRRQQILNSMVAACAASKTDVSPSFMKILKVPLTNAGVNRFQETDWKNPYAIAWFYRSGYDLNQYLK